MQLLGDILQTQEEMQEWHFTDWSNEDEAKMGGESYEWIRMDADFEWICRMSINMPAYMFISQLQQDRDVVAQLESLQYVNQQVPNLLVSTFLTRTVMDRRYFHGVRIAMDVLTEVRRKLVGTDTFPTPRAGNKDACSVAILRPVRQSWSSVLLFPETYAHRPLHVIGQNDLYDLAFEGTALTQPPVSPQRYSRIKKAATSTVVI